jgi:hypothetical protein
MSTCTNEEIAKALALMRRSPAMGDYEIFAALVRDGIEQRLAARLVEFLPIVYTRMTLANLGVHLAQFFFRRLPDGQYSAAQPYRSEPVWNAAVLFAHAEVKRGITEEDFLAVAERSSELSCVNKALNAGEDMKGGTTETIFLWPEEGPGLPDEIENAKTVYLIDETGKARFGDAVYKQIKTWNRWQIVTDKTQADIVLVVTDKGGLNPSFYLLKVVDPKTGDELWTVRTTTQGKLWRSWGSVAESLVSDIRKSMPEETK